MTSRTTENFRKTFRHLPVEIQRQAQKAYRLWKHSPNHPSLHFKKVHDSKAIYSVRIGIGWRAVGVRKNDEMIWFWIGSHADYDNLLAQL